MFQQKRDTETPAAGDAVQQARTRARQRLIGAVVLLGIGVIGFPLVFETQPRPIPVDIPIEIPKKDSLPPLSPPPAPASALTETGRTKPSETVITESREDAGRDVTPPPRAASQAATASASAPRAPVGTASSARPAVATASSARPSASAARFAEDGDRARALLEGREPRAAAAAASAEGTRFVVQVGAFADADSAREARQRVEKLGLKSYTQVAETPGGKRTRVRIGPFASREDADVALAKVKAGGFAAVVLTL